MNELTHVGVIMDGNRRWAKKLALKSVLSGHEQGVRKLMELCSWCLDRHIPFLSVYAFSTENWNRPEEEVVLLMKLLKDYLKDCVKRANNNNMKVRVIGEKSRLSEDIRNRIEELEKSSAGNTGLNFTIALNYGSRDEMIRAMQAMIKDCREGRLNPDELTEQTVSGYLDTAGIPYPDLLIRTSGEERLSNFLLWQMAYTEFYFTDVLWPDFNKKELIKAIESYNQRNRRYGKVEEV